MNRKRPAVEVHPRRKEGYHTIFPRKPRLHASSSPLPRKRRLFVMRNVHFTLPTSLSLPSRHQTSAGCKGNPSQASRMVDYSFRGKSTEDKTLVVLEESSCPVQLNFKVKRNNNKGFELEIFSSVEDGKVVWDSLLLPWVPEVFLACGGNFRCRGTSSAVSRSREKNGRVTIKT